MTITEEDTARCQETASDFHTQHEPDSCYPTSIKNALDDLAERQDVTGLKYSISDIAERVDYVQGKASATDKLSTRLDPLLQEAGYEAKFMGGMDYDQLQTIIQTPEWSLPICDLHEQYFEDVDPGKDAYVPEPGIDGYGNYKHTVIPFKINDDDVLYFDPYIQFFHDLEELDEAGALIEPKKKFHEWWSRPEKRWALWFEPMKQHTLTSAMEDS